MKTAPIPSGDVIWSSNDDLLSTEGCLPVIGSCQVSSILSTLDNPNERIIETTETLSPPASIIQASQPPLPQQKQPQPQQNNIDIVELNNETNKTQNNYVVLKDNGISCNNSNDNNGKKVKKQDKCNNLKNGDKNFENVLYFVCNLCPFLCTKNTKITEHLENAHKNKTVRKIPHLKCPACTNVFSHKMSLRSHLLHDHGVGNSDLSLIVQAVVYYANKAKNNDNKNKLKKTSNINNNNSNTNDNNIKEIEVNCENVGEESNSNVDTSCSDVGPNLIEKVLDHQSVLQPQTQNQPSQQQQPISGLKFKKTHSCLVPLCKVQMQNVDNLNYHMNCHKDTGFSCLICNETFSLWKQLSSHLWRFHKIDMELYSCDQCNYKSVSLAKLNNIHKLIHGNIKSYICTLCKKAFKNSKQLNNHKTTHKNRLNKTKFSCEICLKTLTDKRQLKIHMNMVHEKIKPFLCNFCPYKGSSRSSLKMHIRQHTGEKPFACDSCSYTTSDHNSLRRHKLRHTGQKPYKCSYCSYACIQSSTYKVHLKTKHPGQEKDLMFTCTECQFRSVNKEMFTLHTITVHNQKPQFQ